MKWKVIVFETETGKRLPVLFPAELTHRHLGNEIEVRADYLGLDDDELVGAVEIANRMTAIDAGKSWRALKPVAAGFVRGLRAEEIYGESDTLNLKADGSDLALLNGD